MAKSEYAQHIHQKPTADVGKLSPAVLPFPTAQANFAR
jgi:hypothetical protein